MVQYEMRHLIGNNGGKFILRIKCAEQTGTNQHCAVGQHVSIRFGRLDDAYIQPFAAIGIYAGGSQFRKDILYVRSDEIILIADLFQLVQVIPTFFVHFLAQLRVISAFAEILI